MDFSFSSTPKSLKLCSVVQKALKAILYLLVVARYNYITSSTGIFCSSKANTVTNVVVKLATIAS